MRIPQNTSIKNRSEPTKAAAVRYRRRVERAEMADWSRVTYVDPATGRSRVVNVRHS